MEKLKDVGMFLGMIAFFGLLTGIMVHAYIEEYDFFSFKKQEAIVETKVSEHSLFRPATYHVRIRNVDDEAIDGLSRVARWKFNKLEEGSPITVYHTYGNYYYTISDLIHESTFFLFAIGIFGMFTLIGLFALITEIPGIYTFVTGLEEKKKKKKKGDGLGVLYAILAVFAYFSGRFLVNLFDKLNPFMKETTDARIIDKYQDTSYRKYQDSEYTLTLQFNDMDGNRIETMKEVTHHMSSNYTIGETLPVTYSSLNPFNVFVQTWNSSDIVGTLFYLESFLYIAFTVLIVISLKAIRKWKQKDEATAKSK